MKTCKIDIESGKVVYGRSALKRIIEQAPDGQYMVRIQEWKSAKTNLQNAFFHGPIVNAYSDYTGMTYDRAKLDLKRSYGQTEIIMHKGERCLLVVSVSRYSKEQMTELIDKSLEHLEHECGIILSPELRKQYMIDKHTGELVEM